MRWYRATRGIAMVPPPILIADRDIGIRPSLAKAPAAPPPNREFPILARVPIMPRDCPLFHTIFPSFDDTAEPWRAGCCEGGCVFTLGG